MQLPAVGNNGIRWKVSRYNIRRQGSVAGQAASESATAAKDEALETLVEGLRDDIRYAENSVDYYDDKLKLIGWAGRKRSQALAWRCPVRRNCWKVPGRGRPGFCSLGSNPPVAAIPVRVEYSAVAAAAETGNT